jgi:hypothetical protein
MGTDHTTGTPADGWVRPSGVRSPGANRVGFLSVWLVWADVVPGDEATQWKISAVAGRYG